MTNKLKIFFQSVLFGRIQVEYLEKLNARLVEEVIYLKSEIAYLRSELDAKKAKDIDIKHLKPFGGRRESYTDRSQRLQHESFKKMKDARTSD